MGANLELCQVEIVHLLPHWFVWQEDHAQPAEEDSTLEGCLQLGRHGNGLFEHVL